MLVNSIFVYWVKHPVLLDKRPAVRVTTSANNTGCFVMTKMINLVCDNCGKEFLRKESSVNRKDTTGKAFFCSRDCVVFPYKGKKLPREWLKNRKTKRGENSPLWKGGRYIDRHGYVRIYAAGDPHSTTNGWAFEHRIVMSEKIGRALLPVEHVHHIDGNKANNNPENLMIVSVSNHTRMHFGNQNNRQSEEENLEIPCLCGCGKTIKKYDNRGRPRRYVHGHNKRD